MHDHGENVTPSTTGSSPEHNSVPSATNVQRLAEIRARLDAATPGPWHWGRNESESFCWIMRSHGAYGQYDHHADTRTPDDAHFIAHTPTDIAWLLDEVERVRAWGRDWQRAYMGLERKAGFGLAEDEMDEALS